MGGEDMGRRLEGKVSVITGGGRGIGRAIALAFAAEGANIVVTARSLAQIDEVVAEIQSTGQEAIAIQADPGRENEIEGMGAAAIARFGRIDALVNNGGIIGPVLPVTAMNVDEWNETLKVNLTGAMICSREAARHMMGRNEGSIIMISSEGGRGGDGRGGRALRSAYGCSKAAMIALAEAMAIELGPHGIRVNVLSPGGVTGGRLQTLMAAHEGDGYDASTAVLNRVFQNISLGRFSEESEVASAAVFLASSDSSGMTGQVLPINCGQHV
jgi:NAD(P)-dependent dehydrogenase (short-subunit alcohol dehydrogenase family)